MTNSIPLSLEEDRSRAVSIETLGCKVNLFESEYIYDQLKSDRWHRTSDVGAELCIINTCTVTHEADRRSRQVIRRAIRENPKAKIVVTGCYAEMQPDICAEIDGVDLVVPGSKKFQIPKFISDLEKTNQAVIIKDSNLPSSLPVTPVAGFESRSRAFLQIQQGCDNGCTFCIIHKARGASRSVLPTTVTRQVNQYIEQGFQEIVICGIDLGSYGEDLSRNGEKHVSLAKLTRELAIRYPKIRFRWSSIDPAHITDELVSVLRENENVCPHIHLSLQSAAPIILKRMKRRYSPDCVYRAVESLRAARRDLVLSADIMAGFPTESELDFEMTRRAIYDLEISYPHVFVYSERDDTSAARIPKQVPVKIRKERAKLLRLAGDEVRRSVLQRYIGNEVITLVEKNTSEKSMMRSRMANFLPVYLPASTWSQNMIESVRITGFYRDGLLGFVNPS